MTRNTRINADFDLILCVHPRVLCVQCSCLLSKFYTDLEHKHNEIESINNHTLQIQDNPHFPIFKEETRGKVVPSFYPVVYYFYLLININLIVC